jgi:hypothetical protein
MIAGHFGFATIVKSRERSAPLWALMLATVCKALPFRIRGRPGHSASAWKLRHQCKPAHR